MVADQAPVQYVEAARGDIAHHQIQYFPQRPLTVHVVLSRVEQRRRERPRLARIDELLHGCQVDGFCAEEHGAQAAGFDIDPAAAPAVFGGNVEVSQRLVDTLLLAFEAVAGNTRGMPAWMRPSGHDEL